MNFNFENNICLETARVTLRPVQDADKANLLAVATSDKMLLQYSPKQVYTKKLLEEYINNALLERQNNTRYSFTIFDKQSNTYAGSTAFLNVSNMDGRLEIGATWLGKQFHGTGLNTQCKSLLLDYAFNIGVNRVEFRTDERNLRSRAAIEKIGGKMEGIHREDMMLPGGYRRNTVYYSILKKEWKFIM